MSGMLIDEDEITFFVFPSDAADEFSVNLTDYVNVCHHRFRECAFFLQRRCEQATEVLDSKIRWHFRLNPKRICGIISANFEFSFRVETVVYFHDVDKF
jgi:hypothetical protein